MPDVKAIAARVAAATAGPWTWWTSNSWRRLSSTCNGDVLCPIVHPVDGHPEVRISPADMAFIAEARTDVPALLARVAELEATEIELLAARAAISAFLVAEHDHGVRQTHESLMRVSQAAAAMAGVAGCGKMAPPVPRETLGNARQRYIEKLLSALSFMHADDITRENAHSLVDELWQLMLDVKARGVEA